MSSVAAVGATWKDFLRVLHLPLQHPDRLQGDDGISNTGLEKPMDLVSAAVLSGDLSVFLCVLPFFGIADREVLQRKATGGENVVRKLPMGLVWTQRQRLFRVGISRR